MNDELLDIFDEHMNRIGTASRLDVHRQGLWHQTFQCWIAAKGHSGPMLLFQKRHPDKDTHPNKYDITSAGHLLSGETAEDGVRELEEEIGVRASFSQLVPIGVIPVEMRYKTMIDREFCHVFLYECDLPLEQYSLQHDEVVGIVQIAANDAIRLFSGETDTAEANGLETDGDGQPISVRRQLRLEDFVPHGTPYYKRVLDAVISHFP